MKKVQTNYPNSHKLGFSLGDLGILGLKIALLALKVMYWSYNSFLLINLSCPDHIHIRAII